jgi:hypothetical protein
VDLALETFHLATAVAAGGEAGAVDAEEAEAVAV